MYLIWRCESLLWEHILPERRRRVSSWVITNGPPLFFFFKGVLFSECVMFAFGRRFEDKQRFVMMLSVILWHTLLQVQSGGCYALRKHTHTRTDRNAHGIRPPSWNLSDSLSFYPPSTFLPLFVSLPFSHTHSPCSVSSFSFPFPGHWPVFGSEADGSLGSSGFVTP